MSFWRKNTSPSLMRATEWLVEASTSKTRIKSSSPDELTAGMRSLRTIGLGVHVVSAARSKFSISRAPLRLKPVTSPLSSIPITSLPPAALANALMCFAISLSSFRALLRSKYWFSLRTENRFTSFVAMGCCMVVSSQSPSLQCRPMVPCIRNELRA